MDARMQMVGTRIIEAANLAVEMHLQAARRGDELKDSRAIQIDDSGEEATAAGQQKAAGGAGGFFTDGELPPEGRRDERRPLNAEGGAE
jgi:hypothetical protein